MIVSKYFILIFCGLLLNVCLSAQQKDSSIMKTSISKKKQPCPVDTHGVSLDTDGDGVPDCRDKEILTSLQCFPVDSFGVGKCPEPPCCAEARDRNTADYFGCPIEKLPSIKFKEMDKVLSKDSKTLLDSIASEMNSNPVCNVKINGYYNQSNKKVKLKNEQRAKVIYYYIVNNGVSGGRLNINIQPGGAINRFYFIPYR